MADGSGGLVWANRDAPEASPLIHLESEMCCPPPVGAIIRSGLEEGGESFTCRYSTDDGSFGTFRLTAHPLSDSETPDSFAEALSRGLRETGAANKASVETKSQSVVDGRDLVILDWRVDQSLNRTIYFKHPRQSRVMSVSGFASSIIGRVATEKLMVLANYALGDESAASNPFPK
jgi:hypothetical protein